MRSPHMGPGTGGSRDRTYYEMLVNRLEFNNNQYVQGVLNRDKAVCTAYFPLILDLSDHVMIAKHFI